MAHLTGTAARRQDLIKSESTPEDFTVIDNHSLRWLNDILIAIGKSGMSVGAIIALVLDNTTPASDDDRGITAWKLPED